MTARRGVDHTTQTLLQDSHTILLWFSHGASRLGISDLDNNNQPQPNGRMLMSRLLKESESPSEVKTVYDKHNPNRKRRKRRWHTQ